MLTFDITKEFIGALFGWIGNIFSVVFFSAPIFSIIDLVRGKISHTAIPALLYIFSILNCLLWTSYGILRSAPQMYVCNTIGASITFIWIVIYLIYCVQKKPLYFVGALFVVVDLMFQVVFFSFYIGQRSETLKKMISYVAMVINIVMYAAPGEKMFTVYKTNNYQLLPVASSIAGFFCSMSWLIYGIIESEIGVIVPNLMGMLFAVMQLIVYCLAYSNFKKDGIIETEEAKGPKVEPIPDSEHSKPLFEGQEEGKA